MALSQIASMLVRRRESPELRSKLNVTGPGELQMNLHATDSTTIKLLRPPQRDLTISFADNLLSQGAGERIAQNLRAIASSTTLRAYRFQNLAGEPPFENDISNDTMTNNYALYRPPPVSSFGDWIFCSI